MIAQFILPQSPSSKLKKQLDLYHFFVAQNPRVTNFKDMSSNFCIKVWLRPYLLKYKTYPYTKQNICILILHQGVDGSTLDGLF